MFRRVFKLGKLVSSKINPSSRHYCSDADLYERGLEEDCKPKRSSSSQPINKFPVTAERLKTRSVLAVSGKDSLTFLNNLTTNELSQIQNDEVCAHTLFLNSRGRVIHDALIYKPDGDDTLFIECDISSLQALYTHLIMFRANTNVEIRSVEQDVGVWAVYDAEELTILLAPGRQMDESNKHDTTFLEELDLGDNVLLSRDPRMWPLGVRVLAPKEIDISQSMKNAGVKLIEAANGFYKSVRYRLGVAEGISEIGYGRCAPVEINGDYTNAISPTKTNYTGWSEDALKKPVENRMLPLKFLGNPSQLVTNAPITDKHGKKRTPIGYLRGIQGSVGLGLMHVPSVLSDKLCSVGKVRAECISPPWWKAEARTPKKSTLNEARQ